MTQTYEDLDAITHLLEEKQSDLELAAKIGKNLLEKNRELETRLAETEKKLSLAEDSVSQLRHTISIKDSLIQIYSHDHHDDDNTTVSSGWISPGPGAGPSSDSGEGFSVSSINFSHLTHKIRELEEENFVLREERNRLTATADQLDEQEGALIRDCARQLVSANVHIRTLSDELSKRSDAFLNQQSEVTRLLTRGLDSENRIKQLSTENAMLINRLNESQASQLRLSNEVCHLRDKYDECLALFHEARAEVRVLRKRSRRAYLRSGHLSTPASLLNTNSFAPGSLQFSTPAYSDSASTSLRATCPASASDDSSSSTDMLAADTTAGDGDRSECSLASDLARTAAKDLAATNINRLFRAMDQVRSTRKVSQVDDAISTSGFVSGSEPSDRPAGTSPHNPDDVSMTTGKTIHNASIPQTPLKKWIAQSDAHLTDFKRHSWLGFDSAAQYESMRGEDICEGFRNIAHRSSFDDSLLPNDPSAVYGRSYLRLPQRLQIVKPMDGSEVLQQWQRLATPNFTQALFDDPLPRVQSRAGVAGLPFDLIQSKSAAQPSRPSTGASDAASSSNASEDQLPSVLKTQGNLSSRFGFSLPAHLMGGVGYRSRSLEHLRSPTSAHRPTLTSSAKSRRNPPRPPSAASQYSFTSLISALLPFSLTLSDKQSGIRNPSVMKSDVLSEPVRLRPLSPVQGTRGLLDVSSVDSDPISLQRVATVVRSGSSCIPVQLPTPQPPPLIPHGSRSAYPRALRNPNLSGITEESPSPPKPHLVSDVPRESKTGDFFLQN